MKKHILIYGLMGGALIVVLKAIEYRYLMVEHAVEIYGALIAALFSAVGIWLGLTLTKSRERVVVKEVEVQVPVPVSATFVRDDQKAEALGLTKRELEVLELIAAGLSTREIAERVFVSENTVKTHAKRLFEKLGAKRRTQAVQLAKEAGLIG